MVQRVILMGMREGFERGREGEAAGRPMIGTREDVSNPISSECIPASPNRPIEQILDQEIHVSE